MKGQWSDLPRRLATVSLGAPAIVIILSHRQTSIIFFQAVHFLCTLEWVRLCPISPPIESTDSSSSHASNRSAITCTSTVLFPAISVLIAASSTSRFPVYLSLAAAIIYLSYYLDVDSTPNKTNRTLNDATVASIQTSCRHCLHGLLYLTISFHSWLKLSSQTFTHTVYLLFIVWNSDTGALLGGRIGKVLFSRDDFVGEVVLGKFYYGRRLVRFVKKISPKKSFTGFGGGIVLGMGTAVFLPSIMLVIGSWIDTYQNESGTTIVGLLEVIFGENTRDYVDVSSIPTGLLDFDHIVPSSSSFMFLPLPSVTTTVWMRRSLLGIILSIFGIIGDMVESAVKRSSGTKDSGKLLPGHGGLLDRFDSTFFAVGIYFHLYMNESYHS